MTDRYPLQTKICIVYNLILKNLSEFDILFVYASMICCSWSGWYFTFAWQEVWNWWVMNKHFFSLAGGNKIWPQVNPNFLLLNTGKCWTVAVWSECVHPVFCWIVNQTKCKMWPNCEKEKVALAQLTFIACAGAAPSWFQLRQSVQRGVRVRGSLCCIVIKWYQHKLDRTQPL